MEIKNEIERKIELEIEKLNLIDTNWMEIVQEELDNGRDPSNEKLAKAYNHFFDVLCISYKKDREITKTIISRYLKEQEQWMLDNINKALKI